MAAIHGYSLIVDGRAQASDAGPDDDTARCGVRTHPRAAPRTRPPTRLAAKVAYTGVGYSCHRKPGRAALKDRAADFSWDQKFICLP